MYHSNCNCIIETASKTLITGCKNSVIPNDGSVAKIEMGAFADCAGLLGITIPDSVTHIGNMAFYGCTDLTSITIPNSVTEIDSWAFANCTGLTSINYNGTKEQWNNIPKGEEWDEGISDYTVHCTDGDIRQ